MAAALADRAKADTTMTVRVNKQTRDLIDSAAAAEGKSRTESMFESARLHAIDVLLDQRVFPLNDEQTAALLEIMDNPPAPNQALRDLRKRPKPWK